MSMFMQKTKKTHTIGGPRTKAFLNDPQTYADVENLAQQVVLYAMKNIKSEDCFFDMQSTDSIFYKVYDDLSQKNRAMSDYFALHLEERYEITFPIR